MLALNSDGADLRMCPELGIYKSSIQFRHVQESAGENDLDSIVLRTGAVERPHYD